MCVCVCVCVRADRGERNTREKSTGTVWTVVPRAVAERENAQEAKRKEKGELLD